MADMVMRLEIDGEYLAYCAMKQALEDIREEAAKGFAVDTGMIEMTAAGALACEERLGGS